jgi:hypothetical protein
LIASTTVIMIGCAVAVPVGTPPRNGDVCRLVVGRAVDVDGAGAWALDRTAAASNRSMAARTDFTAIPFSPDAKLDEEGTG